MAKNNSYGISLLIIVLFIVAMCVVLSYKANFFVDEIFTYGKANYKTPLSFHLTADTGGVYVPIEDGKIYYPGGKALMDYVVVQPEHRFDYANVWKNEAKAVHPPFHSALVHTVSSFFPGKFSRWFAGIINIVFAVLTLFVLRLLSRCYIDDERLINFTSIAFAFSGGILSAITFLRMYIMAMFWVTLLTYCFVRRFKEQESDRSFYLKVFTVTVCGAMSHYYCIVYAAFICGVFGVYLLFRKEYREIVCFVSSMAVAGIVSYLIFPAVIIHIFSGPRGIEVMENAAVFSDFFSRLKSFLRIINEQLLGNCGNVLALGLIIMCVALADKYYNNWKQNNRITFSDFIYNSISKNFLMRHVLLIVPTVLFFITVAKITVYRTDRYMFPIYGNIILIVCLLLVHIFHQVSVSKICKLCLVCLALCIITIKSWSTVGWPYLYQDSKLFLEKVSGYSSVDNICLYDAAWKICPMLMETQAYKSIQFCNYNNEQIMQEIVKRIERSHLQKIVLTLITENPKENETHIKELLKKSNVLYHPEKIGSFYMGTSYILNLSN